MESAVASDSTSLKPSPWEQGKGKKVNFTLYEDIKAQTGIRGIAVLL